MRSLCTVVRSISAYVALLYGFFILLHNGGHKQHHLLYCMVCLLLPRICLFLAEILSEVIISLCLIILLTSEFLMLCLHCIQINALYQRKFTYFLTCLSLHSLYCLYFLNVSHLLNCFIVMLFKCFNFYKL